MLERLDFWLAVLTLGALAWYELRLGRFVRPFLDLGADVVERGKTEIEARRRRRPMRLKPRPIRGEGGRFDGSLPAVTSAGNEAQRSFQEVTALECEVTGSNEVAEVTVSPEEAALIGLRLGRGMSPSAVLKSLPGYSPKKNYDLYKAKVDQVRATLAALEPAEEAQEPA